MSDQRKALLKRALEGFIERNKLQKKEVAEKLNISEATLHRWLGKRTDRAAISPTGTTAAVLGLLLAGSGLAVDSRIKNWARRGLELMEFVAERVDLTNPTMAELLKEIRPEGSKLQKLQELQEKERQIIEEEMRDAIERIDDLHDQQSTLLWDSKDNEPSR